jgi:hypothetical protein
VPIFIGLEEEEPEDIELEDNWNKARGLEDPDLNLQDYITADDDLRTDGDFTLQEIVNDVACVAGTDEDIEDCEEIEVEEEEKPPVTRKEALKCLDALRRFMDQNSVEGADVQSALDKLEDEFTSMRLKQAVQTRITEFLE